MKKVSLVLSLLIVLVSVMLMGTQNVFAATTDEDDPMTILMSDNDVNSTPANEVKTPTTTKSNDDDNNTVNNTVNNTNTNNASVYTNNTNTPNSLNKAGLEDSMPTIVLIVVFGISAIYAYKKINDYKNV